MKKNKTSTSLTLNNSIGILTAGCVTVSLAIDRQSFDPFNTIKLILLLLTSTLLASYLITSYLSTRVIRHSQEFFAVLFCIFFLLSVAVAAGYSEYKLNALFGDTFRRNGALQYVALSILFLFTVRSVNFFNIIKIYKAGIFLTLIIAGYGLIQISGNDFYEWNNNYNSMISTLGNPNFASAILAILSVLCCSYVALNKVSLPYKFIACLACIGSIIAIVSSDSRQGIIAFLIGLLFYFSLQSYMTNRKIGLIFILCALSVVLIGILGMLQKGPLAGVLYKESVSVRGFYWRAGFEMFLSSPLHGVGLDNYGLFFKASREPEYVLRYGYNLTSTNAHNTFIQLFATGGLLVGLSYLAIIAYVFVTGIKLLRKITENDRKIVLGLLSSWLAFQSQSLISIDNIGVSIWGWLLGGSIVGLAQSYQVQNLSTQQHVESQKIRQISLLQPLISCILLVPTIVVSYLLIQADRDLLSASSAFNADRNTNMSITKQFSEEVIDNPIAHPTYKLQAAQYIYFSGDVQYGYRLVKDLFQKNPRDIDTIRTLLDFEQRNKSNKLSLITLRIKLAEVDPWNAENYYELCRLSKETGQVEKAFFYRNKILAFAPNSNEAKKSNELVGNP